MFDEISRYLKAHSSWYIILTIISSLLKQQSFPFYGWVIFHCIYCSSFTQSCPIFATPWTAAHQASLSFTISQSLLKLMSIKSVMPSNYLVLCPPLLLLPSIFPSIRVFSIESAIHIRWPKYLSFSISPSNKYPGLISFRIDWFDLLTIQGTLKCLL